MRKKLIIKTLAVGIIVLFIGAGIHPAFAVENESIKVNQQINKDCGCKDNDKNYYIYLEIQLRRLEIFTKLLSTLSRYNPNIKDKCDELSNEISTIFKLIDENKNICKILWSIIIVIIPIAYPIYNIIENSPENSIRYIIASFLFDHIANIHYILWNWFIYFKCEVPY